VPRGDLANSQTTKATLGLRELLLDGAFKPRERVPELRLVEELGVSRTPLRIALMTLEHEGLLETLPGGGFVVREFTRTDIDDAIELRGVLEGTAARLAAERLESEDELEPLRDCCREMDAVVRNRSIETFMEYLRLNEEFHHGFRELAKSRQLGRALEQLLALPFAPPSALLMVHSALPESWEILLVAQHQHRTLVDAIGRREGARADAIAREHARIARQTSRPSVSGSWRSRIASRMSCRSNSCRPSVPRVAQTTWKPSRSRYARTSDAMSSSSSTRRILPPLVTSPHCTQDEDRSRRAVRSEAHVDAHPAPERADANPPVVLPGGRRSREPDAHVRPGRAAHEQRPRRNLDDVTAHPTVGDTPERAERAGRPVADHDGDGDEARPDLLDDRIPAVEAEARAGAERDRDPRAVERAQHHAVAVDRLDDPPLDEAVRRRRRHGDDRRHGDEHGQKPPHRRIVTRTGKRTGART